VLVFIQGGCVAAWLTNRQTDRPTNLTN